MQPQGLGRMGGSTGLPGKSGLTFDNILSHLQGKQRKSQEMGAELHNVTSAVNNIHLTQQQLLMQPQGLGRMGGSMGRPGKSGLTFDHILSHLQGELQKSQEMGAELHNVTSAVNQNNIHNTLGGSIEQFLLYYYYI